MPKKSQNEPPDEQSKRFMAEAQRMIDAGELNPTEADKAFQSAMDGIRRKPIPSSDGADD